MTFIVVHGNFTPHEDTLVALDEIVEVQENPVGTGTLIVTRMGSLTVVDSVEGIEEQIRQAGGKINAS